jgi:hypothetical protein
VGATKPKRLSTGVRTVAFAALSAVASFVESEERQVPPASTEAPVPAAAPEVASWETPEVSKAQLEIRLTDAQQPQFKEIVGKFVDDLTALLQAELNESPPNLEEVFSRSARLKKEMDKRLQPILTAKQWDTYAAYKYVLTWSLYKMLGPWPSWEALKAQLEIRLTDEQQPQFNEIVGKLIDDLLEFRKDRLALDQAIHWHILLLAKEMDKELKPILRPEQWKPYLHYRHVLQDALSYDIRLAPPLFPPRLG